MSPSAPSKYPSKGDGKNLYRTVKVTPARNGWGKRVDYLKKGGRWLDKIEELKKVEGSVFPHPKLLFKPFNLTRFEDVRVCIIAGAPLRIDGANDGLALSCSPSFKRKPSHIMMFLKELRDDTRIVPPLGRGSLTAWACNNGILLLNSNLTNYSEGYKLYQPTWDMLMYETLKALNYGKKTPIVFIFLGTGAQRFSKLIDKEYHYVIEAPHPMHFDKFRGCRIFSKSASLLRVHPRELWGFSNIRQSR